MGWFGKKKVVEENNEEEAAVEETPFVNKHIRVTYSNMGTSRQVQQQVRVMRAQNWTDDEIRETFAEEHPNINIDLYL